MHRSLIPAFAFSLIAILPVFAQQPDTQDKPFDLHSSIGDVHVGKDADAQKQGLPLYPGARPKQEEGNDPLNFGVLTENFGLKLIVAKYTSDDPPAKVVAYYRDKLKRYGKVLECHTHDRDGNVEQHDSDKNSSGSKELKCDENSGPVVELKVGNEDNQHVVAVEPGDAGKGSNFALVYLYSRSKHGEI
jgi:hypothetical protein